MGFNADAFLAAREPWTLTIGGRTYAARPVSIGQVLDFQKMATAAAADPAAQQAAITRLLRLMFPAHWSYLLPGRDPVQRITALDPQAQSEVLRDFFEYLARTLHRTAGTTRTTPPSPPSSAPTPPPTPDIEGVAV